MPVAGLPAALETLLTSLLASEEHTSWKVDGDERGNVVVVLRFRQRNSQPLLTSDRRGFWRKKTPAQRRRDHQRAEEHRQRGEQRHSEFFSRANCVEIDVEKRTVSAHAAARNTCSVKSADYVTQSPVTSDPSSCADNFEEAAAPVSHMDSPAVEAPFLQDDPHSATVSSPSKKATLEDLQNAMSEMSRSMSRALEKQVLTFENSIAGVCGLSKVTDQASCLPSAATNCLPDPEAPDKRTILSSPYRPPSDTRPALRPRSAVRQRSVNKRAASRTSPTRLQPSRAARRT